MTYTVTGTGGCADATTTRIVTVNPLPVAIIQTPLSNAICQGSTLLLTASGGISYQWFLNSQGINGANAANYNASQQGVYTVQATSPQGCVSGMSNPVTLNIINAPVADFSFDKFCAEVLIQFSNLSTTTGSGVVTYSWLFGDGISSTLPTPTHTYLQAGIYSISLSVTPVACPNLRSTKVKSIAVEKNPGNVRYRTINAVIGQQVQLNARNFVNANYNWAPSVGLNNYNISAPIFNFNQEKEYLIKIITQAGCVSTDTQLIRVFDRIDIFVADAFTPNSDGKNDKIIPKLVGVQKLNYFKVINRWGQLLYTTNIEGEGWDGFYKGVKQQLDTYAWIAEGVDLLGNLIKRSGTFILLR
jgi:gliding motility-associated-like protein